jgi:hypothetical protein
MIHFAICLFFRLNLHFIVKFSELNLRLSLQRGLLNRSVPIDCCFNILYLGFNGILKSMCTLHLTLCDH